MKYALLLLLPIITAGCETTDADGNVTRFDAKGATEAMTGALDAWQRIDRQNRIVGYDVYGNPIYR